jgi:hypothetical protein
MAITEPQEYYVQTTNAVSASSTYYVSSYTQSSYTITYTGYPSGSYTPVVEPKEIVDWDALRFCKKGFVGKLNYNRKTHYPIRQPFRCQHNKRKMNFQRTRKRAMAFVFKNYLTEL